MKRSIKLSLIVVLVLLVMAALPSLVSAGPPPPAPPGGGPPPPQEEKDSGSITSSGSVTDSGTGVVFNVPNLPEGVTVNYDFRKAPPQDSNGVYGLTTLVGINFKGGSARVEVKIPVPEGFKHRELSVAQYVNGKYVLASGYRSGGYMVFTTSHGGDFTIVETAYLK